MTSHDKFPFCKGVGGVIVSDSGVTVFVADRFSFCWGGSGVVVGDSIVSVGDVGNVVDVILIACKQYKMM